MVAELYHEVETGGGGARRTRRAFEGCGEGRGWEWEKSGRRKSNRSGRQGMVMMRRVAEGRAPVGVLVAVAVVLLCFVLLRLRISGQSVWFAMKVKVL